MAALTIIIEPVPGDLLAAYGKNIPFIVTIQFNSGAATRPPVNPVLEAQWTANTDLMATELYNSPESYAYLGANEHLYTYWIDASEAMQAFFANENTLTAPGAGAVYLSTSFQAELIADFYMWIPTGPYWTPTRDPVAVTSQKSYVINAVINPDYRGVLDLQDFDPTYATLERFLTNKPQEYRVVCPDDHEYLAAWAPVGKPTYYGYDSAGTLVGAGTVSGGVTGPNQLLLIGAGPQNFQNYTYTVQAGLLPGDPGLAYYDVFFSGLGTETVRFYVTQGCCRKYRLFFLNQYGIFDGVTIDTVEEESNEVKRTSYERQRGLYWTRNERGANSISARGTNEYNLVFGKIPKASIEWFKELLRSPNAFLQRNFVGGSSASLSDYEPVVLVEDTFAVRDSGTGIVEVSVVARASNSYITQRN